MMVKNQTIMMMVKNQMIMMMVKNQTRMTMVKMLIATMVTTTMKTARTTMPMLLRKTKGRWRLMALKPIHLITCQQQELKMKTTMKMMTTMTMNTNVLNKKKSIDSQQQYAGNVQKYMNELKGSLPSKKKRDNGGGNKRGGRHGAANMKGMGTAESFKLAKKALTKANGKVMKGGGMDGGGRGKKGKGGGKRR
mmetsp:Transcript_9604/g.14330  ORF Transcript_9604/g.14330 Transcript_9604/m.14330 type:complete len:193 (-) Transcript_9604:320-898(-)